MLLDSLKAGALYFVIVFVAGFVLGAVRVLAVVPMLGELNAVLVELPIILTVSWISCRRVIDRFRVESSVVSRLVMGALAFNLLIIAEVGLGVLVFGRSLSEATSRMQALPGVVGLAGQIAFALFPLAQIRLTNRR
jgi:hypothetical protein